MSAALKFIAGLGILGVVGFLAAFFWFAFTAALRPGGPDPEADAACVAIVGALISAVIAGAALTFPGDDW